MPRRKEKSTEDSWVLEEREDDGIDSQSSDDKDRDWAIDSSVASTRSAHQLDEPQLVMPSPSTIARASKRSTYDYDDEDESPPRSRRAKQPQSSPSKSAPTRRRQRPATSNLNMGPPGTSPFSVIWSHFILPVLSYSASLLGGALFFLKPLLSILLALWFVYFGFSTLLKSIFQPQTLLSPICSAIPFSTTVMPGICAGVPPTTWSTTFWPWSSSFFSSSTALAEEGINFGPLMQEQAALEEPLFNPSQSALALPLEMKRSEASVRDLRSVVEYSTLPSRKLLAFELSSFVDAARQAGADLAAFNARVARAADQVLLANRWTLSILDDLAASDSSSSLSLLARLNPFAVDPRARSDAVLRSQYLAHAAALATQIDTLVADASALLALLATLDNHLDAVGSVAARDGLRAAGARDELLANVWTWLGGNRRDRARVTEQLRLLGDVGRFRRAAVEHVGGVIVRLQEVGAGLEGLRERVGAVHVVGEIEDGMGRGARERVPLRVHVESVQMGVERLEEARGEGRRREAEVRMGQLGQYGGGGGTEDKGRMVEGR